MPAKPKRRLSVAYRLRWLIALLGTLGVGLALVVLYAALYDGEFVGALALVILLWSQVVFLAPRPDWTSKVAASSRPMRGSLVIVSALFAFLGLGLIGVGLELAQKWHSYTESSFPEGIIIPLLGMWLFWTIVFLIYRGVLPTYVRLRRHLRVLLIGSLLEAVVSFAVLVTVPDRHNCECARGSFFGLFLAACVALWAFGPATILVFWERKYRHEFLRLRCTGCQRRIVHSVRAGLQECRYCDQALPARMIEL